MITDKLPEIPIDPYEAFDAGYKAGMAFAANLALQLGLQVDLLNPSDVMRAAAKRGR